MIDHRPARHARILTSISDVTGVTYNLRVKGAFINLKQRDSNRADMPELLCCAYIF